jgi:hypothetical protein
MSSAKQKPYWEMNLEELREATKEFDKPVPASKLRPLTKSQREQWERSRAGGVKSIFVKRNRPKSVTLKLDETLVNQASEYASRKKMTFSEVVENSLRSVLSFDKRMSKPRKSA